MYTYISLKSLILSLSAFQLAKLRYPYFTPFTPAPITHNKTHIFFMSSYRPSQSGYTSTNIGGDQSCIDGRQEFTTGSAAQFSCANTSRPSFGPSRPPAPFRFYYHPGPFPLQPPSRSNAPSGTAYTVSGDTLMDRLRQAFPERGNQEKR